MTETIKKTLFAGIGAAVVTKETIESAFNDWIAKGKVSKDEATQFAEKLVKTGSELWDKTRSEASGKISECLEKAPFARSSTINALEARVSALEQAIIRAHAAHAAANPHPAPTPAAAAATAEETATAPAQ